MMRVRVVIVTFNSADIIGDCLRSLEADVRSELVNVVVVDNCSTDATTLVVQRDFPSAQLIGSGANIGYGAGNNLGAKGAGEELIFFLNPDARVEPEAISTLALCLDARPDAAIAGPAISDEEGRVTLSTHPYVTPALSFWIASGLHRILPINRTNRRPELRRTPPRIESEVDRLLGAAIMVRRSVFEAVGGFDERFFLYSEEEDLCLRAHCAGWRILYCPRGRVVHIGGQTAFPKSPLAVASAAWSRQFFLEKHYPGVGSWISRWVWVMALLLRWGKTAIWCGHERSNRARGYRLAIMSLISSDFYDRCVRPPPADRPAG